MSEFSNQYPDKIRQSSNADAPFFHRATDLVAVDGPVPETLKSRVVVVIEDGRLTVCRGAARDWPDDADLIPVYRLEGGAIPAVPTGLIFVRFAEEISAAERAPDLARAGYRIERIPPYAPHTAWVMAADGDRARGLRAIDTLKRLPGMAHVEPQLLMPQTKRLDPGPR